MILRKDIIAPCMCTLHPTNDLEMHEGTKTLCKIKVKSKSFTLTGVQRGQTCNRAVIGFVHISVRKGISVGTGVGHVTVVDSEQSSIYWWWWQISTSSIFLCVMGNHSFYIIVDIIIILD